VAELGINLALLIAGVVNFVILLALLRIFAYLPVMKMLDERSAKIQESLAASERMTKQAEEAELAFKEKIREASVQGQLILDRASKTSEEIRARAVEEAKEEAGIVLARAREEISREKVETVVALRREYADLVTLAAGKVIGKSLDKKAHENLINEVLADSVILSNN